MKSTASRPPHFCSLANIGKRYTLKQTGMHFVAECKMHMNFFFTQGWDSEKELCFGHTLFQPRTQREPGRQLRGPEALTPEPTGDLACWGLRGAGQLGRPAVLTLHLIFIWENQSTKNSVFLMGPLSPAVTSLTGNSPSQVPKDMGLRLVWSCLGSPPDWIFTVRQTA